MKVYQALKSLGVPMVAGGFLDQPYVWSLQQLEIEEIVKMMESLSSGA